MAIKEDMASAMPANAAGSGGIDGIGVGPKGEPGVYPKKKKLRDITLTKTPLKRLLPK
jgi:hypothetical protein